MASHPSPPPFPRTARSHRSASHSSSSSLHLDPATQALLANFLTSEAEREQQFRALEDAAHPASLDADADAEQPPMDVDSFRSLFQEDWQISQFWFVTASVSRCRERELTAQGCTGRYSTPFASLLSTFVYSHLPSPAAKVAFICCPTGFVAFQHAYPERREATRLMEFDRRFALLAGRGFVGYDLDEPQVFPDELKGSVEVAVVDPPFMNEVRRGIDSVASPD